MKPTYKSPEVLKVIKDATGVDLYYHIENDICVPPPYGCGLPLSGKGFRDGKSLYEFSISGLCQHCQDKVFEEQSSSRD